MNCILKNPEGTDYLFGKGYNGLRKYIHCDGKSKESKKVIVPDMELTDWERNEEETDKAYSKLF